MRLLLLLACLPISALAADHTVAMKSISFDPKTITIKAGEEVTWKNISYTEHSATADDGKAFDTGMVKPKASSKPVKFSAPGTYPYHCSMHGRTMSGTVQVEAP